MAHHFKFAVTLRKFATTWGFLFSFSLEYVHCTHYHSTVDSLWTPQSTLLVMNPFALVGYESSFMVGLANRPRVNKFHSRFASGMPLMTTIVLSVLKGLANHKQYDQQTTSEYIYIYLPGYRCICDIYHCQHLWRFMWSWYIYIYITEKLSNTPIFKSTTGGALTQSTFMIFCDSWIDFKEIFLCCSSFYNTAPTITRLTQLVLWNN